MAHYARSTPPVHPPGRPSAPEQPWTGWWQPAATADTSGHGAVGVTEAPDHEIPHHAEPERAQIPNAPFLGPATGNAPDLYAGAGAIDRGGLRRVGVPPSGSPIGTVPAAAPGEPAHEAALPHHWGMLETAATRSLELPASTANDADFTVEGVAQRSGDLVFVGITFPERLTVAPDPSAIRLTIVAAANADLDSVCVAPFDGFGPDRVGFTLIAAALNPGAMWVDGHYHVEL